MKAARLARRLASALLLAAMAATAVLYLVPLQPGVARPAEMFTLSSPERWELLAADGRWIRLDRAERLLAEGEIQAAGGLAERGLADGESDRDGAARGEATTTRAEDRSGGADRDGAGQLHAASGGSDMRLPGEAAERFIVRRTLPDALDQPRSYRLFFRQPGAFRVTLDGQPLADYGPLPEQAPLADRWRAAELPLRPQGRLLQLEIEPASPGSLALGGIAAAPAERLLDYALRADSVRFAMAACYGMLAVFSGIAWLLVSRSSLYLYFGAITFVSGYSALFGSSLFYVLAATSRFSYFNGISNPLMACAIAGLLGHLAGAGRSRFRKLTMLFGALAIASAVLSLTSPYLYRTLTEATFAFILLSTPWYLHALRWEFGLRSGELAWLRTGLVALLLSVAADRIAVAMPSVSVWLENSLSDIALIVLRQLVLIAVFVLICCIGLVLLLREKRLRLEYQRVLEQQNEELLERDRIKDGILAERSRISQELHDHVGHTLTASIVQLEASILLLERQRNEGLDKARLAQSLVRKGLDEIRASVRAMREEDEELRLAPALERLFADAEANAGIVVSLELRPLPPLPRELISLLVRAAREGLTNGLRHGAASRFRCRVAAEGGTLSFELRNDGQPPRPEAAEGFGLRRLREEAERLGGRLRLEAQPGEAALSLRLPLDCGAAAGSGADEAG
ncbi:sensor histidine kinase [Paenibacillus pasadenensis]|uniref:sensor histidine kinase n=1 Tax=Paenibacillus pasadenensis TaxID=217090 RepID=UPI00040D7600|nr:sensor histidine kinase [Paenibacillus pasadenensis]